MEDFHDTGSPVGVSTAIGVTRRRLMGTAAAVLAAASLPLKGAFAAGGGTLRLGVDAESAGWYEYIIASYSMFLDWQALYDGLLKLDDKGVPQPYLAESFKANDAFTEFTVKLKPGILFSDGTPLTAGDIKGVVEELKQPTAFFRGFLANVDHIEVVDDLTAKFVMNAPDSWFPITLSNQIQMLQVAKPGLKAKYGDSFLAHPLGTGPFMLDSWEQNRQTVLKRNPHYWRKDAAGNALPYLDQIIIRPIVDETSRLQSLQAGDLDSIMSLDIGTVTQALALKDVTVHMNKQWFGGYGLLFNTEKAPTDDVRIRKALSAALDRVTVVAAGGGDPQLQVTMSQWVPKASPLWSQKVDDDAAKYDLDAAKKLLAEYVNDPKRSDGKAPGTPVKIDIQSSAAAQQVAQSQAVQAAFQDAGFDTSITSVTAAQFGANRAAGNFIVNWMQWGSVNIAANMNNVIGQLPKSNNTWKWKNADVFANLAKLFATDPAASKPILEEIGLIINREAPFYIIGQQTMAFASRKSVVGPDLLLGAAVDWAAIKADGG
jgi:peptide/nickel transport system substrate-binding protein